MGIISNIVEFFHSFFLNGILNLLNGILSLLPNTNPLPPDVKGFVKASIITFVPYTAIIRCVTAQFPFLVLNTTVKLLLRIKSFVPTMGGK